VASARDTGEWIEFQSGGCCLAGTFTAMADTVAGRPNSAHAAAWVATILRWIHVDPLQSQRKAVARIKRSCANVMRI
jgi:hypothetical protein